MTLAIGDRVKHSRYSCESLRLECLHRDAKPAFKRAYADKLARRGTVESVSPGSVKVKWDDGLVSDSLDYMVELA